MFKNTSYFQTTTLIKKALDASVVKHNTISNNIANVNTPNYKQSEVSFETELKKVLENDSISAKKTHEKHLKFSHEKCYTAVKPIIKKDEITTVRNDGNNIDINEEMAEMAKNSLMYDALITIKKLHGSSLRSVIERAGK